MARPIAATPILSDKEFFNILKEDQKLREENKNPTEEV